MNEDLLHDLEGLKSKLLDAGFKESNGVIGTTMDLTFMYLTFDVGFHCFLCLDKLFSLILYASELHVISHDVSDDLCRCISDIEDKYSDFLFSR